LRIREAIVPLRQRVAVSKGAKGPVLIINVNPPLGGTEPPFELGTSFRIAEKIHRVCRFPVI